MTTRFPQISPVSGRWSARPVSLNSSFGELVREFDQLLQPRAAAARDAGLGSYNPVDLYETGDAVVLEMVVPGVRAEDLDINIEGRKLVISGSSKPEELKGQDAEKTDDGSDRRYWLKDIAYGEFSRTVKVPQGVDAGAIDANLENGILRVTMPKAAEALPRKIAVGVGSDSSISAESAEAIEVDGQEHAG